MERQEVGRGPGIVDLNAIGASAWAGAAAGAAAGVGARLAMRGVALSAGLRPDFTLGGTLAIVIIFALAGVFLGATYGVVRLWLPRSGVRAGLIYGLVLSLGLVVTPFLLREPEGELALTSPLVGASLFAPIPVIYGLVLGGIAGRAARRPATAAPRQVGVLWVALLLATLLLALIGLASLPEAFRSPVLFSRAMLAADIPFRLLREGSLALFLFFVLAYGSLAVYIFWRGAGSRPAKLSAVALLAFPGVFIRAGAVSAAGIHGVPAAPLLPALARVAGLGSLVLFMCLFPDGRFTTRLSSFLSVAAGVWLVFLFLNPLGGGVFDLENWPELVVWSVTVAFLGGAVAILVGRYYREFAPEQRRRIRWPVWAVSGSVAAFAALWLAAMLIPDLETRAGPGFPALFVFPPYILPWLLMPLSLAYSMWRRGLWEKESYSEGQVDAGQAGSLVEAFGNSSAAQVR